MARLDQLIEQTSFLLDMQKKSQNECSGIFKDLLAVIEQKLQDTRLEEKDREVLERVNDIVSGQAQKLFEETSDDIDFLNEQFNALRQVKELEAKDPEQAKEVLSMMIEDPDQLELQDTEEFKKSLIDEAQSSRENLLIASSDIKEALLENNAEEVLAILESMVLDQEAEDFSHDFDDLEEDFEDAPGRVSMQQATADTSMCGDCKGCGTGDGCGAGACGSGCDGVDIFEELSKYEQDYLDNEQEESETKN
ncbi:MAG: hypothetical protein H6679_01870 [Epsilonproteobacteria bacterium]|nr:hypothetical protein [Campylobacterota bacterium]